MLRDLLDRLAYRCRLWSAESRSDNLGAGMAPPQISPKNEPGIAADPSVSLGHLPGGLVLLVALGRIAAHAFPSLGHGIAMIVIFLAVIWCAVGLFIIAGELLTKRTESDGDDKGI
jgi:hypothetical protein